MLDMLFSLIPGGSLTVYLTAAAAALLALWRIVARIKKSGVDEQKAKEAAARDKNLVRIREAIAARDAVGPADGGVQSDPRNRDNRGV